MRLSQRALLGLNDSDGVGPGLAVSSGFSVGFLASDGCLSTLTTGFSGFSTRGGAAAGVGGVSTFVVVSSIGLGSSRCTPLLM